MGKITTNMIDMSTGNKIDLIKHLTDIMLSLDDESNYCLIIDASQSNAIVTVTVASFEESVETDYVDADEYAIMTGTLSKLTEAAKS